MTVAFHRVWLFRTLRLLVGIKAKKIPQNIFPHLQFIKQITVEDPTLGVLLNLLNKWHNTLFTSDSGEQQTPHLSPIHESALV